MFGAEGASGNLRGAAGQHGGPAHHGEEEEEEEEGVQGWVIYSCSVMKQEEFTTMKKTQNVTLGSDRSAGEVPRPAVTNTAVMTPVTLLQSQELNC